MVNSRLAKTAKSPENETLTYHKRFRDFEIRPKFSETYHLIHGLTVCWAGTGSHIFQTSSGMFTNVLCFLTLSTYCDSIVSAMITYEVQLAGRRYKLI